MIPFPKKKYNVIYADPPWHYQTWGEGSNRNVTSKYETMSPEEIFKHPVSDLADEDEDFQDELMECIEEKMEEYEEENED